MEKVMLCGNDLSLIGKNWIREPKINGGRHLFIMVGNVFDGEMCVFDDKGVPRLELWQDRFKHLDKLTYVIFDVLEIEGKQLTNEKLRVRKQYLEKAKEICKENLENGIFMSRRGLFHKFKPSVITIDEVKMPEKEEAERLGWEGYVWKNPDSKYVFKRSNDWIKQKFAQRIKVKIKRWEITENDGFVIYFDYNGVENKVVVNSIREQELIRNGKREAEIQFYDISNKSGKLICPSYKG